MKDQLLSIADYLESLEQRIAALESSNIALQETINDLQDNLAVVQERVDNLPDEPEVEVELLVQDEPEEPEMPEFESEPEPEPEIEPEPELEPEIEPEPEPEPEPAPAPAPAPEPVHTAPYQPSLFGPQVSDIRQAISLGDRFLFQRELFTNNGELMQKTLDSLNSCASMDEAIAYISRFGWDQESTTFKLFMNVLRRRFN